MAYAKKSSDFTWVRSIYGKGADAKAQYNYIPSSGMNELLAEWHNHQPDREVTNATPSSLLTCPRVVWLKKYGVEQTNGMTWAVKQRLLLGRLFENQFAKQLEDAGKLLYHWKDDEGVEVDKLSMGKGNMLVTGVPDYLLKIKDEDGKEVITVSDAKTSRSDSFGYLPVGNTIWNEWNYYKYRMQLTAYFMLLILNKDWLDKHELPVPTHCHLFTYALDDGIVRREMLWQPTEQDFQLVKDYSVRFNQALNSAVMPECTCKESFDNFDVKFCPYAVKGEGKVGETCCDDSLGRQIKLV